MSISDAERKAMIRGIEEGDILVSTLPSNNEILYFAVLEKVGLRAVISLPSREKKELMPARSIGGSLEVSEEGDLLSEDGDSLVIGAHLRGVLKGEAKSLVKAFRERIRPNNDVKEKGLILLGDDQTKQTLAQVCALVVNQDYGDSEQALFEMFFRVIRASRSSKESASYLTYLVGVMEKYDLRREQLAMAKSLSNSIQESSLGAAGKNEVVDFIQKIKKFDT